MLQFGSDGLGAFFPRLGVRFQRMLRPCLAARADARI